MPITKTCVLCNREFHTKPSHAARRKYCSYECAQKARDQKVKRTCETCGKMFRVSPCFSKRAKYCSPACYNNRRQEGSEMRHCRMCGVEYHVKPSMLNKHQDFCSQECRVAARPPNIKTCTACGQTFIDRLYGRRTTCSEKCRFELSGRKHIGPLHWRWQGGVPNYRHDMLDWYEYAETIRQRDGQQCTQCRMTSDTSLKIYGRTLDVHHLVPYAVSHDNSPANLTTLCIRCHMVMDNEYRQQHPG